MQRGRAWLRAALLFLLIDSSLAQVNSIQSDIRERIHLQIDAFEEFLKSQFHGNKSSQDQGVIDHQELSQGPPDPLSIPSVFSDFIENAKIMETKIAEWATKHNHIFDTCFTVSGLASATQDELASLVQTDFSGVSDAGRDRARLIRNALEKIPFVEMMLLQLEDRPDWTASLVTTLKQSQLGSELFTKFRELLVATDQTAFLEVEGSVLEKADSLNSFATSLGNLGSISNGDSIMQPLSSVTGSISGGNGPESMNSITASGSNAVETGQGSSMPMSESALGQEDNLASSSTYTSYYSLKIPESASGVLNSDSIFGAIGSIPSSLLEIGSAQSPAPSSSSSGGADTQASSSDSGLGGSGGGSGSSMMSITSSQTSSMGSSGGGEEDGYTAQPAAPQHQASSATAGNKGGACCAGLAVMIIMLGIGAGGEFYIKNMHKFNPELYETHFQTTIQEQLEEFKEYLKANPERAAKLQGALRETEDAEEGPVTDPLLLLPLDFKQLMENTVPEHVNGEDVMESDEVPSHRSGAKPTAVFSGMPEEDEPAAEPTHKHASPIAVAAPPGGDEALGRALMLFYVAYNAVPVIISKHFGFYVILLLVAVMASSAGGGGSSAGL